MIQVTEWLRLCTRGVVVEPVSSGQILTVAEGGAGRISQWLDVGCEEKTGDKEGTWSFWPEHLRYWDENTEKQGWGSQTDERRLGIQPLTCWIWNAYLDISPN